MPIRDAQKSDLPFILELMNHAILNTTSIYEDEPRTLNYIETWFSQKQTAEFPVLIFEVGRKVAAFGTYGTFRVGSAYRLSVEHSVHVHKSFHGKGIGKQLLSSLIERAKKEGRHAMIAGIDSENKSSIKFHEKMGFKEVGRFPEIAFKFDNWLELVLMQRFLNF